MRFCTQGKLPAILQQFNGATKGILSTSEANKNKHTKVIAASDAVILYFSFTMCGLVQRSHVVSLMIFLEVSWRILS